MTGRFGPQSRRPNLAQATLPAAIVHGFAESAEDRTWIATGQGLFETGGQNVRRFVPLADSPVSSLLREGGSLWLRLTGREGVKQFIRSDFAAWFPS